MKPHKHAELIKAWADGAEIECSGENCKWFLAENPGWNTHLQYRIKPVMRKYRVALMFDIDIDHKYTTTADCVKHVAVLQDSPNFVKWLTDWVEYESNP